MCMKKKSQIQSISFSLCQKVKTKPNIKYCFLTSRHSNLDEFVHADMARKTDFKSVNLQFNTVGRWDDDMIVPPSDGPMIIWIDWE